ncbi:hypothetical protein N7481_009283 [Penicillium waksmanii]|uniref:uncharacterized protein n=1 Tax=Penicillium waksmanii TaxID=69791 RepID=UPI0025466AD8|nr:uncharacterized protein N7481_009283 [Penicillium waksmanii]KAJ5975576.1 hypothetical protein N7481_009283 [Penicillium waksmanii]
MQRPQYKSDQLDQLELISPLTDSSREEAGALCLGGLTAQFGPRSEYLDLDLELDLVWTLIGIGRSCRMADLINLEWELMDRLGAANRGGSADKLAARS